MLLGTRFNFDIPKVFGPQCEGEQTEGCVTLYVVKKKLPDCLVSINTTIVIV